MSPSVSPRFQLFLGAACLAVLFRLLLFPLMPALPARAAGWRPTFIAHRGYSDRFPENTTASILEAVAHGAPWIEVDVRMTRDGRLVLHHDASLADVGLPLDVEQATLAQVQARPLAAGRERIPTMDQVLRAMAGNRAKLYLHLKDSPLTPDEAGRIVALCRARRFLGRVRFNSGSLATLAMLRRLAPEAWLEYDLYDAEGGFWPTRLTDADAAALKRLAVRSVGTFGFKVDRTLVRQVHRHGFIIDALVSADGGPFLSERATYREMLALGVDEVMTDHIARYLIEYPHAPLALRPRALRRSRARLLLVARLGRQPLDAQARRPQRR